MWNDEEEKPKSIYQEIEEGLVYRKWRQNQRRGSLQPVSEAPVLQETVKRKKKKKKTKPAPNMPQACRCANAIDTMDLLTRMTLPHNKYLSLLAQPKYVPPEPPSLCQCGCRAKNYQISPRLMQLAIPSKKNTYYNWVQNEKILPLEMIKKLDDLLHAEQLLEPIDARVQFTVMDREREKALRKQRRRRKKKLRDKLRGEKKWVEKEVRLLACLIKEFIRNEPLYSLNYKQMLISDNIRLEVYMRKLLACNPNRATTCGFKKSIIDISDKLACWCDRVGKYVDILPTESDDEGSAISVSTFGESEGEGEGEGEGGSLGLLDALLDALGEGGEDECADSDILRLLIRILSMSTKEYLSQFVDEVKLETITNQDIIDKLILYREGQLVLDEPDYETILTQHMIDWGYRNDRSLMCKKVVELIRELAPYLGGYFLRLIAEMNAMKARGEEDEGEGVKLDTVAEEITQEVVTELQQPIESDTLVVEDVGIGDTEATEEAAEEGGKEIEEEEEAGVFVEDDGVGVNEEDFDELNRPVCICMKESLKELYGDVITAHKEPSTTLLDHPQNTVCCIALKIWAAWLLEVANNAHVWGKWLNNIIMEVREIASIIRGEKKCCGNKPVVYCKDDWYRFMDRIQRMVISWRQYSVHVRDLSDRIIENFHGQPVECCPKCMEDNVIKDALAAHEICKQLREAMETASVWRNWLDNIVVQTQRLTMVKIPDDIMAIRAEEQSSDSDEYSIVEIPVNKKCTFCPEDFICPSDSEGSLFEVVPEDTKKEGRRRSSSGGKKGKKGKKKKK